MKSLEIKYLELPMVYRKQIANDIGCTLMTVRRALELTNPTQGEQPERIRKMAREMGARINTKYKYIEA